jgi:hypothetical protein
VCVNKYERGKEVRRCTKERGIEKRERERCDAKKWREKLKKRENVEINR